MAKADSRGSVKRTSVRSSSKVNFSNNKSAFGSKGPMFKGAKGLKPKSITKDVESKNDTKDHKPKK